MVTIEYIDGSNTFKINNISLVRNFHGYVSGSKLRIVNAYDSRNELLPYTRYDEISVNGITYDSVYDLSEILAPILYGRGATEANTGGGTNVISVSGNIITKPIQISIDWNANPEEQIVAYVNGREFNVKGSERILFKAVRITGDIENSNSSETYFWEFKPGKGNYGTGGVNISKDDLEYISFVTSYENNFINVGEIGSIPIEVHVNANGPYSLNTSKLNVFKATREGAPFSYIYNGQAQNIGVDTNQTTADDFLDVNATPVNPPASTDGKSAYQLAVDLGFEGTVEEWLLSLVGPPGTELEIPAENDKIPVSKDGSIDWQDKPTGTGEENSNYDKGDFNGEFDLSGGNNYYNDYSGDALDLTISNNKSLGSTATVRIQGGKITSRPGTWNFSGDPLTDNYQEFNELTILYVRDNDIRIVNRIVPYNEAGGFSPLRLSNLNVWYEADINEMTFATDEVTNLNDKNENIDLVAEGTVNFSNDALVFGAGVLYSPRNLLLEYEKDFHGFLIFKMTALTSGSVVSNTVSTSPNPNKRFAIGRYNGSDLSVKLSNGSMKSAPFSDTQNFHKLEFKNTGGVITAFLDDVEMTGNADANTTINLQFALGGTSSIDPATYEVKDFFVKAGEMTEQERTDILNYITTKHSL